MRENFIPYEQALEFKELGFDEPCIMQWTYAPELIFCTKDYGHPKFKTNKESFSDSGGDCISAPLYQQAFKWFREEYDLFSFITTVEGTDFDGFNFSFWLKDYNLDRMQVLDTYEEAELACLIKLIEIAKNK